MTRIPLPPRTFPTTDGPAPAADAAPGARACALHHPGDLDERIDRSLVDLHALPGLDARAISRTIGVRPIHVRLSHWRHHHTTVGGSLARIRVETAERLFREQASTLPIAVVLARTADAAGFHSTDEMNRAFLRYRHRSGFEVLLAGRAGAARAAAQTRGLLRSTS